MSAFDDEFETQMRGPSLVIWLVGLAVLCFLVWARFAWIDEIVRAEGEVVSASRPQIIQNLEGGILSELLVAEGDEVAPGDVIARLGSTQFSSSMQELQDKLDAALARRLRLEAEIEGQSNFQVPDDLAARAPPMIASERALLAARQQDYASKLNGARAALEQAASDKQVYENLNNRGVVAQVEVTAARKAYSDAQTRLNEIRTQTDLERANEYSEILADESRLRQEARSAEDRLSRTTITAPMRGIVNNLTVTTIGGVVRPGQELAQIIPTDDALYVDAKVKPQDIAGIVVGQRASVKLSAYDYTIWGSLQGVVEVVSADTFKDERRPELPAHYKVTVRLDWENRSPRQAQIQLRPGMLATVELHTGEKTVLQYLTKPLYRGSSEALRER